MLKLMETSVFTASGDGVYSQTATHNYGKNIMELAIDTGEILTEEGNYLSVSEIELFTVNRRCDHIGGYIKEKLTNPLDTSKYARGLKLIRKSDQEQ